MQNFFRRIFTMADDYPSPDSNTTGRDPDDAEDKEPQPFYPSIFEVFKVRYLLQWKIVADGIPPEMVDLIVDAAEYWPSREESMGERTVIRKDTDRELLRTGPLCAERVCKTTLDASGVPSIRMDNG